MGRKLVGNNGNDKIYTPDALADAIVYYLNPMGVCLDPCAGKGAFIRAFQANGNSIRWCELDKGRDFLKLRKSEADWLITNPPFSKISKFLSKAINLEIPNIAFLCTVNAFWMNGKLDTIKSNGYQITEVILVESPYFRRLNNWPQSGFSLGVTVLEKKPSKHAISSTLSVSYLPW
jgi:hypothetical protein